MPAIKRKFNGATPPDDGSYSALLCKYNALKAENENLKENLFLMSNPDYYKGLLEVMERVESGKANLVTFTPDEFKEFNKELAKHED